MIIFKVKVEIEVKIEIKIKIEVKKWNWERLGRQDWRRLRKQDWNYYPIEVRIKYEVTNYEKSKFVVRKPVPLDSLKVNER